MIGILSAGGGVGAAEDISEARVESAMLASRALVQQVGLDAALSEYEPKAMLATNDSLAQLCLGFLYMQKFHRIDSLRQWSDRREEVAAAYQDYLGDYSVPEEKKDPSISGDEYLRKAVDAWKRCVQLSPACTVAYLALGSVALEINGDFDEAVLQYEAAYACDPSLYIAERLIVAYRRQGALDKARTLCEDILTGPQGGSPQIYRQLALTLMELELFAEAIAYGEKAVSMMPGSVDLHVSLAKIYREAGDLEKSNEVCSKGLELDPFLPVLYSSRGINYERLGEYEKALLQHQKVLELNPLYYKAYNNIGVVFNLMGKPESSINPYRKAAAHLNMDFVHINLINALRELKRYEEALDVAEEFLRDSPENLKVHREAGVCLFYLERYQEAKERLQLVESLSGTRSGAVYFYLAAIALVEESFEKAEILAVRSLAEEQDTLREDIVLEVAAQACFGQGKLIEALGYYESVLDLSEDPDRKYKALCSMAGICMKTGKMSDAEAYFKRAIALDPDEADAYFMYAQCLMGMKKYQEAMQYLKKGRQIEPDNIIGLVITAKMVRNREPEKAIGLLMLGLEKEPENRQLLYMISETYLLMLNDPEKAEPYLERYAIVAPDSWKVYSLRALSCSKQNKLSEARSWFERALQLNPSGYLYNSLGYTCFLMRNFPEAEKAYRKGLEFNDSQGVLYYNMALLYEMMGNYQSALGFWQLSVDSGYRADTRLRNRIQQKML